MKSSWTRRDTTNVLRLLKKYNRLYGPYHNILSAIGDIEFDQSGRKRDDDMLRHLDWWCKMVEARYGMKRRTAITWLVKQYHDRLSTKAFCAKFGNASVDSIVRRLGSKAKYEGHYSTDKYEAILNEDILNEVLDADIYQLTFKRLELWKEPPGHVETGTQMSTSASKVST
jgi:hypothetical protein